VLSARCGEKTLEIYKQNREKIDLVLLDVVTPDWGDREVMYHRLKEINPAIRVLFSSGNGIDDQAAEILGDQHNGFIQKPFTLSQLSQKVREILDKH
jgi:two-component system cell cycle sensor histidine kinase/response regulator CckA